MHQSKLRVATSWRLVSCLGASLSAALLLAAPAPAELILRPQAPTSDQPPPPINEAGIISERRIGDRLVSFGATQVAAKRLLKAQFADGTWVTLDPETGLTPDGVAVLATAVADGRTDLDPTVTPGSSMASPNVYYAVRALGIVALEYSTMTSEIHDDSSAQDAFPEVILAGLAPPIGSEIRVLIGGNLASPKFAAAPVILDAARIATADVGATVSFGSAASSIIAVGIDLSEFGMPLDAPAIGLHIRVPLRPSAAGVAVANADGVTFAGRGPFQDPGAGSIFGARFIAGSNPTFAAVGEASDLAFSEISFASGFTRSRSNRAEAPLNQSSQPNTNPLRPRPQFPPIITIDPDPPVDPEDPEDPVDPVDPEDPEDPTNPPDPTDPDGPDWPDDPDPNDPDNPNPNPPDGGPGDGPDWPDNPDGPDGPDGPDVPDVPAPGAIVLMFGGSLLNSRRRR